MVDDVRSGVAPAMQLTTHRVVGRERNAAIHVRSKQVDGLMNIAEKVDAHRGSVYLVRLFPVIPTHFRKASYIGNKRICRAWRAVVSESAQFIRDNH